MYEVTSGISDFQYLQRQYAYNQHASEHAFKTENVKKFIKREDLHFDLIIGEEYHQGNWLIFSHKYKCPTVTISKRLKP